ncbi:Pimeloyl-ACP methyl ester carboxylesterase [Actinacidiphila yanglinensis]|uniref:Pimeloyl-ACP methyl ester carboxylesterase n=1 Tax=Actinacidiphila yanglinensis TaxID=310779 RepID=A0A1H6EBC5_9ACTN|nr:alpha/beta hydrolase [Actinacidiphila yanglinensis]SEG94085.1 Pimeloyl-ACP methyl ester carboxylesterase [Actinacidiphila yanglinensis]
MDRGLARPRQRGAGLDEAAAQLVAALPGPAPGRDARLPRDRTDRSPLLLLHRFRGALDHWDPAFLEVLANRRRVIVFDSAGVGYSDGKPADTVRGMADVAVSFLDALGLQKVDLLGWSMGGFVALDPALEHPERVRRLVVASSGAGGVPDNPGPDPRVPDHAMREHNDDEDFLFLFHPETETGRTAGLASLRRINRRLSGSGQDASAPAREAQMQAITQWSSGINSTWNRLTDLTMPALFANGAHDVMEHAYQTYAIARSVPDSKTIIYGDAGHAFLFQHPDDFGAEVLRFID